MKWQRNVPMDVSKRMVGAFERTLRNGSAALSLGCCGARAYIDALTDSVAMWAFPGSKLEQYCKEIIVLADANKTLTTFHARRREDVESGRRPTVRQSLERLSS